ncbi:MAG: pyrroloquinoline quinone biosynthesis peptide chaperone PqqD [Pseudomonadota bacterium]|jgi:coenzyme PQQ biosynthesis protein PqqD|nr:MAG: pyrroloquinoline quinone biosynthesis peptide chaperone PqqD [Pseudomonadota bacterium]
MMQAAASRKRRVRLAPGHELRRARRQGWHLVHPAGVVQLNASAAAILALCDGTRTREEIVVQIVPDPADRARARDVRDFLDAAREHGWITES